MLMNNVYNKTKINSQWSVCGVSVSNISVVIKGTATWTKCNYKCSTRVYNNCEGSHIDLHILKKYINIQL